MTFQGTIGALQPAMVVGRAAGPGPPRAHRRLVPAGRGAGAGRHPAAGAGGRARPPRSTPAPIPTARWDGGLLELLPELDQLLPNEAEALALTGPATSRRRPCSWPRRPGGGVVKCGADGVLAVVGRRAGAGARRAGRGGRHDRRRRQHQRRLAGRACCRAGRPSGPPGWRPCAARSRPGPAAAPPRQPTLDEALTPAVILCLAANPSIDRLFEVERAAHRRRPPAGRVRPGGGRQGTERRPGRRHAGRRGAGGDDPGRPRRALAGAASWSRRASRSHAVWVDGESRSSLSVADRARRRLTEFYEHGVDDRPPTLWRRVRARGGGAARPAAAWMTISGSLPPGAPRGRLPDARRSAARCAADTIEQRPPPCDLVKLNAAEAAQLTGHRHRDRGRARWPPPRDCAATPAPARSPAGPTARCW